MPGEIIITEMKLAGLPTSKIENPFPTDEVVRSRTPPPLSPHSLYPPLSPGSSAPIPPLSSPRFPIDRITPYSMHVKSLTVKTLLLEIEPPPIFFWFLAIFSVSFPFLFVYLPFSGSLPFLSVYLPFFWLQAFLSGYSPYFSKLLTIFLW